MATHCTVQVLRGALYEQCGAAVDEDDGRCAAGHGSTEGIALSAEHRRAAPEMNLTPGTWPVTRKFFSVDDHIVEPADVWSKRVPGEVPRRRAARRRGRRTRVLGVRRRTRAHHGPQRGRRQAARPVDDGTDPVHRHDPGLLRPGRLAPATWCRTASPRRCASRRSPVSAACSSTASTTRSSPTCACRAWNDFILEEWCAGRARPVRPDADLPDLGPGGGGRRDPPHRRPRRPGAVLPGGDELPRPARRSTATSGTRCGTRSPKPTSRCACTSARPATPRSSRPTRRSRSTIALAFVTAAQSCGRTHDEPGPPQVPDRQVRDVGGRDRVGAGGARTRGPTGRPPPLLVG